MKRVPIHTPSAPRASAAAVEDAARGDNWDALADRVDDLGYQWKGRNLAGVASRFGALGHDEVAPGLDRADSVFDLAAHADDDEIVLMTQVDDLCRHTEPGHERRGASRDDHLDLFGHPAWHR